MELFRGTSYLPICLLEPALESTYVPRYTC